MGKSSKKTNAEVAPAVPAVASKSGKKGKRDAEVALEKEASAKKQKKEIENVVPEEDIKNLKKALKNVPLKKKSVTSSSEDDSSSESEEEVKVPLKKQNKLANSLKKKSSSSGESSSDDEPAKTVSDKKAAVATKNGSFAAVSKKGKESSSSESDSDEDEDESDEGDVELQPKKLKVMDSVPSSKAKPIAKTVKKECSSSEEDDSSEESSDDEPSKQQQAKKDSVPSSKIKPVAKTVKKESSSSEEDSSEESSDDEPSKQQQDKKVTQASKKSNSSNSSEQSSDEESEDEKPLKTPKKDSDVEMKDASEISAEKQTATKSEKKMIVTTQNLAPGSRTLFIGNLSYDVGQDDVAEFFKAAGEVVDVRLATAADGSFKGFGHVEFATEEDAKKALELNGNELFGRGVRLDVASERGSYTPQSGKDSYQKGSKGQSQTIFVKGFYRSLEEDQIRSSLEEHFGSCGEITRISVPKDYETGAPKGIAYIDFKDQESFNKAFELNGSDLGGYTLTVDEAKPRADTRDGGGRSGGRFGGRGSGRRGGRGDRGRGRDFGGRGRGRSGTPFRQQSAGTASTGKKTTFGDD